MIRLILVVVLIALSITFFFQNRQEEAVLHYFGATTPPTPIYKPILSAFGTGLLIMGLLLFPAWIKLRMELRRTRTALHLAEEELDRLRATQGIPIARPPVAGRPRGGRLRSGRRSADRQGPRATRGRARVHAGHVDRAGPAGRRRAKLPGGDRAGLVRSRGCLAGSVHGGVPSTGTQSPLDGRGPRRTAPDRAPRDSGPG